MEAPPEQDAMEEPPIQIEHIVSTMNAYLVRYTPLELFGYGFAYCALLFLLVPRVAHGLTSVALLLILVDGIQFYQGNLSHTSISNQAAILLLLTTLILAQIIATGKMFDIL